METKVGFSKYEILEKVVQATRDKNVTVEQIEKQLKRIKAKADQDQAYSEAVCKAVVDHFKLAKQLNKNDKTMIAFLVKENKQLKAALPQLETLDRKLDFLDQMLKQITGENHSNDADNSDQNSKDSAGDKGQIQLPLNNANPDDDSGQ